MNQFSSTFTYIYSNIRPSASVQLITLPLTFLQPTIMVSPTEKHIGEDYSNDPVDPTDTHMSAGKYAATRVTTLKPPLAKAPNPIRLLRLLNTQQWLFFLVAFVAWTWDAFDFFTVSLTVSDLAATFGKSNTDITWGITLVLMFRSVGSTIFGIAADRYGRKW